MEGHVLPEIYSFMHQDGREGRLEKSSYYPDSLLSQAVVHSINPREARSHFVHGQVGAFLAQLFRQRGG